MKEIKVDNNSAGKRFDKFLGSYFSECSMGFIFKMLRKKNITLNGKKATGKELLSNGDIIAVFFSDETFYKFANKHISAEVSSKSNTYEYEKAYNRIGHLDIVYEDDHILLINKPVGILSQKAEAKDVSVNEWLIGYLLDKNVITSESLGTFRPSVCNRLDRNTSGLLICSKSLSGARKMAEVLKDRSLHKYYKTIVVGNVKNNSHLSGYLYKDKKTNKVSLVKEIPSSNANKSDYSAIETSFEVLRHGMYESNCKNTEFTELEVLLHTGKTHQIRAHLSSEGHPIIGDGKYGNARVNDLLKKDFGLKFQLLHSYKLVFPKIEGELSYLSDKVFEAKLPDLFLKIETKMFL